METVTEHRCFGGMQGIYRHQSHCTKTPMQFSVYVPPTADGNAMSCIVVLVRPDLYEENFTVKAGAQKFAAEYRLIIVAPDTSPRGASIFGEDDSYDFGTGAGFYVDATQSPWSNNYRCIHTLPTNCRIWSPGTFRLTLTVRALPVIQWADMVR